MEQVYSTIYEKCKQLVVLEYERLYIVTLVICCFLERETDKVFKFIGIILLTLK